MAEEDPNLDDENEGGEERSSNRTFLILAGLLGGGFLLILRTYMPGSAIVEQKWAPPGVAVAG